MVRRISAVIVIVCVLGVMMGSIVSAETYIPPIDTRTYQPILNVVGGPLPLGEAGSNLSITLPIKNSSHYPARHLWVTPVFQQKDASFFEFDSMNPAIYLEEIMGNRTEEVTLEFYIDTQTPTGTYALQVDYKYENLFRDPFTVSETIYFKVENPHTAPKIIVDSVSLPTDALWAGMTGEIGLNLVNRGTLAAHDVNVRLEGLKYDGFTIRNDTNHRYQETLEGEQASTLTFLLEPSPQMSGGSHSLIVHIEYKDALLKQYTEQHQFFIRVQRPDDLSPQIVIDILESPSKSVQPHQDYTVKVRVSNTGAGIAHNLRIEAEADAVMVPKAASFRHFNSLEAGESQEITFVFAATESATTRSYPLTINLQYEEDREGGRVPHNLKQYLGIFVSVAAQGTPTSTVPKVIISRYRTQPQIVPAGSQFSLDLAILNTNSAKAIQNIKVYFTVSGTSDSGSVFTPVESSNTFFIDYIGPKRTVNRELLFYTMPDAQAKTYTLTANFEYEDNQGNQYTSTELIGIPVVQKARLETSSISIPSEVRAGSPLSISFEFYNRGRDTLNNLMIKIEGDFNVNNPNYYVGNFNAGWSDYFDTMIVPEGPGNKEGSIVFTYDDAAGNPQEIRHDFTLNVMQMSHEPYPGGPDLRDPRFPFPEEPSKGGTNRLKNLLTSRLILLPLSFVVLLVMVILVVRKRKKAKKGLEFDE